MKGLSIKQPWANLIVAGFKTIETRKWKTQYRGEVLICSTLQPDFIPPKGMSIKPLGYAIGLVELYKVMKMTEAHEDGAMCDYYEGAYSWFFKRVRKIKPIPIRGRLNLFSIDEEIKSKIEIISSSDLIQKKAI